MSSNTPDSVIKRVDDWLVNVVIGLNLCPFAKKPYKQKQIHLEICDASSEQDLLTALEQHISWLEKTDEAKVETSILILTQSLDDFYDYNDFLDLADALIDQNQWRGIFQIASFHPDYQFGGTQPDDQENLTNRSPYPLLHILRETSLDKAVASHPNVDLIPEQNIIKMNQLSKQQVAELFTYL